MRIFLEVDFDLAAVENKFERLLGSGSDPREYHLLCDGRHNCGTCWLPGLWVFWGGGLDHPDGGAQSFLLEEVMKKEKYVCDFGVDTEISMM